MIDLYQMSRSADPSEEWRRLRRERVVHELLDADTGQSIPVMARYNDVRAALLGSGREGASYLNRTTLMPLYEPCPEALALIGRLDAEPVTAAGDPPFHSTMRKALESVFPWRREQVALYDPMIQRFVDKLLDDIDGQDEVDLVDAFAAELPLRVILHLLGAPARDGAMIRAWSDGQIHFIWGRPRPKEQVRLLQNLIAFWRYCLELVKSDLRPDSITAGLLGAGATPNQAASFAFNLLVAGHETTRNLMTNLFLLLLERRDRWERVRESPHLVPRAVAETNRYLPAIIGWQRETARDVTIGDTTLPEGTRILLHLGAANRDMPDGDDFNLDTPRRQSLSFGAGPHYCIGSFLALREAEIALSTVLRRFPDLEPAADSTREYPENLGFYAPDQLRIATNSRVARWYG